MTGKQLMQLSEGDLDAMSLQELKSVKLAAGHAYSVIGDHEGYGFLKQLETEANQRITVLTA